MEKKFKIGFKDRFLTLEEIGSLIENKNYLRPDKRILEVVNGRRILDIGCNIGVSSYEIAKRNPVSQIFGIDSAEYLIEIANELYKNVPNVSFEVMNACELEFGEKEFDCVLLLETIEHLDEPVKAVREIHRVLKPDGTFILSTNNVYYSRFLIRHIWENFVKRPPRLMIHDPTEKWNRHIFCWDLSTLYTLLNENGFVYVEHFHTGSSGFYLGKSRFDKIADSVFSKIFPIFRAIVVIRLKKR